MRMECHFLLLLLLLLLLFHCVGHNWGSDHDPNTEECNPRTPAGKFIMYPSAQEGIAPNNKVHVLYYNVHVCIIILYYMYIMYMYMYTLHILYYMYTIILYYTCIHYVHVYCITCMYIMVNILYLLCYPEVEALLLLISGVQSCGCYSRVAFVNNNCPIVREQEMVHVY